MSKPFGSNSLLIIAPNNFLVKHYFLRSPSGEAQRSGFDAMRRSKGVHAVFGASLWLEPETE